MIASLRRAALLYTGRTGRVCAPLEFPSQRITLQAGGAKRSRRAASRRRAKFTKVGRSVMADAKEGGCQCGAVRYRVADPDRPSADQEVGSSKRPGPTSQLPDSPSFPPHRGAGFSAFEIIQGAGMTRKIGCRVMLRAITAFPSTFG